MKNGLGYIPDEPDERDHIFSLSGSSSSDVSGPVSLEGFITEIFDQGATNSCVAQALALALDVEQRARGLTPDQLSRLWLYYWSREAGGIKGDVGSRWRDTIKALVDLGCPPEEKLEFSASRVNQKPHWSLSKSAHDWRGVRSYERVLSPDAVRAALAQGSPVVGGWAVDRDFTRSEGPSHVERFSGDIVGNHAMCIVGFDGEWFRLANSWSRGWRQGGLVWVHERIVEDMRNGWLISTR